MADNNDEKKDHRGRPSAKLQAVKMAMEQIERQYGRGAIMRLGERMAVTTEEVIPTGSFALDIALGIGGVPRGRVIEIFGPEASGKTTIALSIIAQVQKKGGVAAFIDAEHALDPTWAEKIGVNLDDLLISQPDTGEQALEIAETLIRSGGVDLVVVDSVAALVPRSEIEGEMGEAQVGVQARLMSQALRKLTAVISKSKTTAVFTNQLRLKIGVFFGNPETTPGGLAMKFYASIRMDVRKIKTLKKGDDVVGSLHQVKVVKNKMAPPFKKALFEIDADGISQEGEVIDLGIETGVIEKSGAFLKYGGETLGQGRDSVKQYLKEHTALKDKIFKEVWKKKKAS
ncbi:MAG TPA: recombinase RecA [Patescibacteria group bacterium]|nr:recombinase RecA [Patescibacteria group bacterium]